MDKFNINGNVLYKKSHFVHPILIYGYDSEKENLLCLDIDFEKGYNITLVNFNDFLNSFFDIETYLGNGGNTDTLPKSIVSYKLKEFENAYEFDLDNFLSELNNYLNSSIGANNKRNQYLSHDLWDEVYGIDVYDKFIKVFQNTDTKYLGFSMLRGFSIHKNGIYERLQYIDTIYTTPVEFKQLIVDFEDVCKMIDSAIYLCIKYNTLDKRPPTSLSRNPKFTEKALKIFIDAKEKEYLLLQKAFIILKSNLVLKKITHGNELKYEKQYISNHGYRDIVRIRFNEKTHISRIIISNLDSYALSIPSSRIIFTDSSSISIPQKNILPSHEVNIYDKCVDGFDYIESENTYGSVESICFTVYSVKNKLEWDFNNNLLVGCKYMENQKNRNQLLCEIYGRDPFIVNKAEFNGGEAKYIYLKFKTACISENAQMFFTTPDETDFSEEKAISFPICQNLMYEYVVDMSDNKLWNGIINKLRFDPICYDNGDKKGICDIAYINITDTLPAYDSVKQFSNANGVNGWSYHTCSDGLIYRDMFWNPENSTWYSKSLDELCAKKDIQSSYVNFASVRRWTSPVNGNYKVNYILEYSGTGHVLFVVKKHRKTTEKHKFTTPVSLENSFEINMEKGEFINFEFKNDSIIPEYLKLKIEILKS